MWSRSLFNDMLSQSKYGKTMNEKKKGKRHTWPQPVQRIRAPNIVGTSNIEH